MYVHGHGVMVHWLQPIQFPDVNLLKTFQQGQYVQTETLRDFPVFPTTTFPPQLINQYINADRDALSLSQM